MSPYLQWPGGITQKSFTTSANLRLMHFPPSMAHVQAVHSEPAVSLAAVFGGSNAWPELSLGSRKEREDRSKVPRCDLCAISTGRVPGCRQPQRSLGRSSARGKWQRIPTCFSGTDSHALTVHTATVQMFILISLSLRRKPSLPNNG